MENYIKQQQFDCTRYAGSVQNDEKRHVHRGNLRAICELLAVMSAHYRLITSLQPLNEPKNYQVHTLFKAVFSSKSWLVFFWIFWHCGSLLAHLLVFRPASGTLGMPGPSGTWTWMSATGPNPSGLSGTLSFPCVRACVNKHVWNFWNFSKQQPIRRR